MSASSSTIRMSVPWSFAGRNFGGLGFICGFGARPDAASAEKRRLIQAPRWPGILLTRRPARSARRAPRECGRRWRGQGRCPSRASSHRARAAGCGFPSAGRCRCRPRRSRCRRRRGPRSPGCGPCRARPAGTAPIASVAFLMMLVSACEISRRSKCAGIGSSAISTSMSMSELPTRCRNTTCRTVSATSSEPITGFGMRANCENSSTMRLMSSTWRTIVSVHCSNTAWSSVIDLPYLRFSRSADKLDRRERVLDLVRDAARDVGPGRGALRARPGR